MSYELPIDRAYTREDLREYIKNKIDHLKTKNDGKPFDCVEAMLDPTTFEHKNTIEAFKYDAGLLSMLENVRVEFSTDTIENKEYLRIRFMHN